MKGTRKERYMINHQLICRPERNLRCWEQYLRISLDWKQKSADEGTLIESTEVLKKELMDGVFGYQDADMKKQGYPNVDTKLVGERIKVLSRHFYEDREVLDVWAKGEVISIPVMKENNQQQKINGQQKKER